ncbi:MAG: 50S ribosomal protein L22, partial [Nanoarchaeota archaeon]
MTSKTNPAQNSAHVAIAKGLNLPVSTKHCIEICDVLRYRDVSYAKRYLEGVVALKTAVPFKKYIMNTGHKKGMSSGRFPQKAAKEVLRLLNSVESNAQFKGLDTSNLKITKLLANKASIPMTGKRHRGATKRTHLEVEVMERKMPKAASAAEREKK